MIRKELRKWGGKSPVRKAAIIPASGKSPVRKAGELKFGRAVFQLEKAIIPASGKSPVRKKLLRSIIHAEP